MVARLCTVSGRVQGVYYRASAQARARELHVTGYARNLPDGRVEVLACGPSERVEEFVKWLWIGPVSASVTDVTIADHAIGEAPRAFTVG